MARLKSDKTPKIDPELYHMTQDEIAIAMGTTRKNVAMIQQRALKKIARQTGALEKLKELVIARRTMRHG
jgi:transcriptional regulator